MTVTEFLDRLVAPNTPLADAASTSQWIRELVVGDARALRAVVPDDAVVAQIVALLDGTTWDSDTPDQIAAVLRSAGHVIHDSDGRELDYVPDIDGRDDPKTPPYPDRYDVVDDQGLLVVAVQALENSADATGCSDDLTVVSQDALNEVVAAVKADTNVVNTQRALLKRCLPMLVRLGDFIGNDAVDPDRPDSLGARCDLIGDIRDVLEGGK